MTAQSGIELSRVARGSGWGGFLGDGSDEGEVNVEAELEKGLLGNEASRGQRLARRKGSVCGGVACVALAAWKMQRV